MEQKQEQSMELTYKQEIHQIRTMVSDLGDTVERIHGLLTGNILDRTDTGMVGKIKEHENRIGSLERKMDRFIYILVGASAFGGYGIIELITKVLNGK